MKITISKDDLIKIIGSIETHIHEIYNLVEYCEEEVASLEELRERLMLKLTRAK